MRLHRSSATVNDRRRVLFALWAFIAPRLPLRITPDDVERFLLRPPEGAKSTGLVLSDASRATYSSHAKAFYRWAFTEGLTPFDRLAKFVPPKVPVPIPRALEQFDLDGLFAYLAGLGDSRLEMLAWLAYNGLRVGEIARLRIEHVYLRGVYPRLLVHGKGDRVHTVALAPIVATQLAAWLADRPRSGYVITSLRDPTRPLTPKTVSQMLSQAMHDAGLDDSGHALRHTFATQLLAETEGTGLRAVSRMLGHASTAITERVYTSSYDDDARKVVGLLPDPRRR